MERKPNNNVCYRGKLIVFCSGIIGINTAGIITPIPNFGPDHDKRNKEMIETNSMLE